MVDFLPTVASVLIELPGNSILPEQLDLVDCFVTVEKVWAKKQKQSQYCQQ